MKRLAVVVLSLISLVTWWALMIPTGAAVVLFFSWAGVHMLVIWMILFAFALVIGVRSALIVERGWQGLWDSTPNVSPVSAD
jgi:hypothetical protein